MNRHVFFKTVIILIGIGSLVAAAVSPREASDPGGREITLKEIGAEGLTLVFQHLSGKPGVLEAELCQLDGTVLAKATRGHKGDAVSITMSAPLKPDDLAAYYVRYRFSSSDPFRQRSLFFMSEILETIVLAHREYLAGTRPIIRVIVRDRADGSPVRNAAVAAALTHGNKSIAAARATTDHLGEAPVALELPNDEIDGAKLKIEVSTARAKDAIEETISIKSGTKTLLTTDKPLYQPGQTIHMRALSLARPKMTPLQKKDVVFEVEDSKGNKVFKHKTTTDEFGVSHADFVLADELNQGDYRIRQIVDGAGEEKTVNVSRYVLPKFKIDFSTDRKFYQPGETVQAELQADYFFGKPVAGGEVHVSCAKFDVEYVDFQSVEGKTDESGHYTFEVKLPDNFVGQPLEAGKASAKFDITVIDTADHKEKLTRNVTVTANPIIVAAVPEGGELVPGLENKVYVVTTYADSTPAACKVTWANAPGDKSAVIETDAGGFGEISVVPEAGKPISLELAAADEKGNAGKAAVELKLKQEQQDDRVLVRTDRSLLKVGDQLAVSVFSTRKSGPVYIDLIKDRQTHLTKTLDLVDGKATTKIALDPGLSGTIQVNAYVIGRNGVIVRDRRLAIVDPANDLSIAVSTDRETYLPAGPAKISFRVTNAKGNGVASALGVMVVDEAVFALQEMQPGLEKVYFYLEREIAKPRYEIHGFDLGEVMPLKPLQGAVKPRRDDAARVLLASAEGVGDYSLHVNTYEREDKTSAFQNKMQETLQRQYVKIQQAFAESSNARRKNEKPRSDNPLTLDDLVGDGYLSRKDTLDPWGNAMKVEGRWNSRWQNYQGLTLRSPGIDGKWDTADDVKTPLESRHAERRFMMKAGGGMAPRAMAMNGAVMEMAAMPMAAEAEPAADAVMSVSAAPAEAKAPRVREYFPETLYFNPAVITDGRGLASLDITMADSITTWRMTCMASSALGELGSGTAGLRVFQDFFVDVDFPVALTQNDQVWVPVAVYNYLDSRQDVKLAVEEADWFELKGDGETTLTLGPSEVKAVYFPIVVKGIGFNKFTVFGYGAKKQDAVSRSVEVVPDGKEHLVTMSGRLEGSIAHKIAVPAGAIDGASKIFVKVYPGVLSQVVEGLDKMLRMPFGCFEQTSSVTYPNILVLDYMKTTGQITPELQMKAEGFINAGYQRLVSFEVPGGGFEWFGKAPAHRILTAYGLMEFYDMSRVFEVDAAIINRTRQWLARCQEKDGSYKPSEGGIREGAIDKFTDDLLRNTAYITWALAHSGYKGSEIDKGVAYIADHLDDLKDNYTIALTANALTTIDPKGKTKLAVLDTLFKKRTEEDDVVYWKSDSETPTHGRGASADIEVTALAVQAFVRAGRELGTIGKAVTYLAKNKDAYGTWQSTQATIQALRAMLMAEIGATQEADAKIEVVMNGKKVKTLTVNKDNSDVLQLVDMKDMTREGENAVELKIEGEGSLLYQVVGRYYLPYPQRDVEQVEEPLLIDLKYDRTNLAEEDILQVTATAEYNRPGRAKMVIVDLGLPPGFTLIPDRLNKLVESGAIQKYSVTGRQIIVYMDELVSGKPIEISYQLLAKYPLKVKTAKSTVYEYYDPDSRGESKPVELTVAKKN